MLIKHFFRLQSLAHLSSGLPKHGFATLDRINYYSILEVEKGATEQAIRKAYAEVTRGIHPETDPLKFKTLNEAFVILTDNKTRDAYDSLLSVRKTYYLNDEESKEVLSKSYLANRKDAKSQELKKKINIDDFGRYKGGLPNKRGVLRGKAKNVPGTYFSQYEVQESIDQHPEHQNITDEKAESFKEFHQDEREARTMKWPWFSFEVDYHFFTFRRFRKGYWPYIKLFLLIGYIIPTLYFAVESYYKRYLTEELIQKANTKREKALAEAALAEAALSNAALTEAAKQQEQIEPASSSE